MNEAMNIKKRLSDLLESVPTSTKQHPLKTPERKVKSKPKETRVDPVLMQAMMMQTSLPEDTTDDRSFKPIDGVTEDSDFTHLFPTESAQPQFTPTFFRYTVSELKGVFKALGLQVSESQSRFIFEYLGHLDVAFLFFLSLVWSVLLPWAPRLEWMALVTVSGRSFWRAWNESHEFFFIFVALMMTLSGMTIAVQVKLSSGLSSLMIPFLASVLLHWSTISYYRKRDPTAQSQWFTFIILDLLLKPLNGSMVEVTVSSYCLVYGVFVLLTTVAAVSKEQWNQNEAAGVPGYNVNGKMVQPWNWDAVHGTIVETFKAGSTTETAPSSSTDKTRPCSYFSNHWNKSDRFELVAECISEETATLAYLIPSSLATTFCLDDETLAGARKSEFAMHNINAHVDQSPPHYISLDQFKVFVNGHLWKEFTLDSSLGVFVVNGLIAGKSYKIVVGVKGYLSVPIRIVMSHGAGV